MPCDWPGGDGVSKAALRRHGSTQRYAPPPVGSRTGEANGDRIGSVPVAWTPVRRVAGGGVSAMAIYATTADRYLHPSYIAYSTGSPIIGGIAGATDVQIAVDAM